ncbi:MAG: mechanosensitive ion channel family protein [Cellvibrio sp.]
MESALHHWLAQSFPDAGEWLYVVCVLTIIAITAVALHIILHYVFIRFLGNYLKDSSSNFRRRLFESHFFSRFAMIIQGAVIYVQARIWLPKDSDLIETIGVCAELWMLLFSVLTVFALLTAIEKITDETDVGRRLPIRGFSQSIKLITSILGLIFAISIVFNKSPIMLLSGLGAMTAILTLVFKDTILGFVAGIQLSANRMLQVGDWVEMPKYNADGDVIEINLNTVKVRNWDKTITTIPAYALITDSFKNWRGMQESGGRRIKRSFFINATSVKFLTQQDIDRLRRASLLSDYIESKITEITEANRALNADLEFPVNGRRLTNLGTFRAYLTAYLKTHPNIHQGMTAMVRQIQPDEKGIAIEIYAFTNTVAWLEYERIQSDIFDHIFAVIPEFNLQVYQAPTGQDLQNLTQKLLHSTVEKS